MELYLMFGPISSEFLNCAITPQCHPIFCYATFKHVLIALFQELYQIEQSSINLLNILNVYWFTD